MSFKLPSLVVILLAAVEIAPLSWARIFLAGRNYPSGEYPIAAVVQDFNNDGVSDIVSANGNDQNISVFLGNPDGTFGQANTFSVGAGAAEVASADLNGDGNADLVVTDDIQSAYVVLGNGDGTFGRSSTISLHGSPLGIAIADLNGDGILDLAIALFGPFRPPGGDVAILLGVGDGSFASPVFYDLSDHSAVRLVAIDLNHDGKLDLAVAVQRGAGLAVLLGNGDGTFQPAVFSQPGDSNDIAAADFNGDGNVDLALVATFDTQVRVVLGNGDGTFQPPTTYSSDEVEFTVPTADLSRDGVPDLVVGGGDHVSILLGNGDGTFGAPVLYGVGQRFARIGYFNHDRDPDVVAGGGFSAIGVAFGRGDGTLRAPLAFAGGLTGFDSGDFDGDGNADIVDGAPLSFLRGLGDGTFAPAVPIEDLFTGQLVATDLNNDGKLDFLARSGSGILTYLGNGDGTFQAPQFTDIFFDAPWPVVADFNNDGQVDVGATGYQFGIAQLAILLGKGDGSFEPPIYYQTADVPQSPITADFNLDGNPDLAISHTFGGTVSIYLGHGDGTFDSPLTITSRGALYLAAGDVNRDSKPDLVVGGANGLNLFLGNGDGTFQAAQSIYSRYGPVKVADLDRDGRLDVAVSPGETIVVLRGRGDGTFSSRMQFPVGSQFSGFFVLSDLNGDRTPEAIVSTGVYTSSLTVLLNTSGPRR